MKEKSNKIFLLNSTELYEKYCATDAEQPISHTGQMDPESVRILFKKTKEDQPLLDKKRNQFQKEWEELSETQTVLRLWIDDEIKGVREHHYDPLIIKTLENLHRKQETKDFIKTGILIEEIYIKNKAPIDIFFLEYRIRHLVYNGVFEMKGIPRSMRHYRVKLR